MLRFPIHKSRIYLQFLFSIFFTFHIAATVFDNIPKRGDISNRMQETISKYLRTTGTSQSWKMFTSAPLVHRYEIETVLTDSNGNTVSFPPLLPGLRKPGSHFKEELFFIRSSRKKTWHLERYLKRACLAASGRDYRKFTQAHLRIKKAIIQRPDVVKNKGLYIRNGVYEYGETSCDP